MTCSDQPSANLCGTHMQAAAAGAKTEEVVLAAAAAADPETASMTMVMFASHRACLSQTLSHKATGILMVT